MASNPFEGLFEKTGEAPVSKPFQKPRQMAAEAGFVSPKKIVASGTDPFTGLFEQKQEAAAPAPAAAAPARRETTIGPAPSKVGPTKAALAEAQAAEREDSLLKKAARFVLPKSLEEKFGLTKKEPNIKDDLQAIESDRQSVLREKRSRERLAAAGVTEERLQFPSRFIPESYEEPTGFFGTLKEAFVEGYYSTIRPMLGFLSESLGREIGNPDLVKWGEESADRAVAHLLLHPELMAAEDIKPLTQGGITDPRAIARTIGGVAPFIVSVVGASTAAGLLTRGNPLAIRAAGSGTIYAIERANAYRSMLERGIAPDKADTASNIYAVIATVLEEGLGFIPSKFGLSLTGATNRAISGSVKESLLKTLPRYSLTFLRKIGEEGAEEGAQQLAQNLVTKWLDGSQPVWENVAESVAQGSVGSLGFLPVDVISGARERARGGAGQTEEPQPEATAAAPSAPQATFEGLTVSEAASQLREARAAAQQADGVFRDEALVRVSQLQDVLMAEIDAAKQPALVVADEVDGRPLVNIEVVKLDDGKWAVGVNGNLANTSFVLNFDVNQTADSKQAAFEMGKTFLQDWMDQARSSLTPEDQARIQRIETILKAQAKPQTGDEAIQGVLPPRARAKSAPFTKEEAAQLQEAVTGIQEAVRTEPDRSFAEILTERGFTRTSDIETLATFARRKKNLSLANAFTKLLGEDQDLFTATGRELGLTETNIEKVKKAVKEAPKTAKQVAEETGVLEPSVRRILGEGAKEGTFERVDKGVYVLRTADGKELAYIQAGDAREVLPKMAAEGAHKFDMVFLDIPYKTAGVVGGNRGIDFDTISPDEFKRDIVEPVKKMMRSEDAPVVYMYSNSKTGLKDMQRYTGKLIEAGLQIVARGEYNKTYKSGEPMKFGKYLMPPEGILVLNTSGKNVTALPDTFDFKFIAPLYKGHYQTEKPAELLEAIIKGTTKVGDTVLDPFAGSGVTPAEAVRAGRKAVAIEKEEEVVKKRITPRVAAAAESIADVPKDVRFFHGTTKKSAERIAREGFGVSAADVRFGDAVYLARSKKDAEDFGYDRNVGPTRGTGGGLAILEVTFTRKPRLATENEEDVTKNRIQELKDDGFDGVIVKNEPRYDDDGFIDVEAREEVVIWNKEIITVDSGALSPGDAAKTKKAKKGPRFAKKPEAEVRRDIAAGKFTKEAKAARRRSIGWDDLTNLGLYDKKELRAAGFDTAAAGFGETATVYGLNEATPVVALHWMDGALDGFAIHPDFQRQGVGARLMRELIQDEKDDTLTVHDPNDGMLALLRSIGEVREQGPSAIVTLKAPVDEKPADKTERLKQTREVAEKVNEGASFDEISEEIEGDLLAVGLGGPSGADAPFLQPMVNEKTVFDTSETAPSESQLNEAALEEVRAIAEGMGLTPEIDQDGNVVLFNVDAAPEPVAELEKADASKLQYWHMRPEEEMRARMRSTLFNAVLRRAAFKPTDIAIGQDGLVYVSNKPSKASVAVVDRLDRSPADAPELTPGPTGGSSAASSGFYVPPNLGRPASLERINPVEVPELLDMVRELGSDVNVKKLRGSFAGMFRGRPGAPIIELNPGLFEDIRAAASTLAHELGHFIDWLPDQTLKRGSLLNRMASLQQGMKETFGDKTIKNSTVRNELKDLTRWWKPFNENVNPSFTAYRFSGRELYADALSVLLNSPGDLQERAPTFFKLFFDYLDRKPEVKEAYFAVQEMLSQGRPAVVEKRREALRGMFDRSDYKAVELERVRQEQDRERRSLKNIWSWFKFETLSTAAPFEDRVRELKKKGVSVTDDDNPIFYLNERNYVGGKIKESVERNFQPVFDELERNGLSKTDLREVLFYERILNGDRGKIANPKGLSPEAVAELMGDSLDKDATDEATVNEKSLRAELGESRYTVLKDLAQRFRDGIKAIFEEGYAEGIYGDELMELVRTNNFYVPFKTQKYMDQRTRYSVSRQVGTLLDIEDPIATTIDKMAAIVRAVERNKASRSAIKFLQANYPGDIQEARTRWIGTRREIVEIERQDRDKGTVVFLEGGKPQGFYVDAYVAKSIKNETIAQNKAIIGTLQLLNSKWFKPVFIGFNLGFQAFNVFRDFQRFWKNVPEMTMLKAFGLYRKAWKDAVARGFDNRSELISEMERNGILGLTFNDYLANATEDDRQVDLVLRKYGLGDKPSIVGRSKLLQMAMKVLDQISALGNTLESLPKVAAYIHFKGDEAGPKLDNETRDFIRRFVGSPDFLARGEWTRNINAVFLFSNAIAQGIRSDYEIARYGAFGNPKSRAGWWWKTTKVNILPKIVMYAGVAGVFGQLVQEVMKEATEYDKTNYVIVPIGKDANKKAVYLRMPQDETGRFIGATFWKSLQFVSTGEAKELQDIAGLFGGQIPTISPAITLPVDIFKFLTGQNVYDSFRQRTVLTETEMAAGGKYALKPILTYIWNEAGGNVFLKLFSGEPTEPLTGAEKVIRLPILSNIIGRFLKITDYGTKETTAKVSGEVRSERARRTIDDRKVVNKYVQEAVRRGLGRISARELERDMIQEVIGHYPLKTKEEAARASALRTKFRSARLKGVGDIYVDSIVDAQSNEEKIELLKRYRAEMEADRFKTMVNFLLEEKAVSPYVISELRK